MAGEAQSDYQFLLEQPEDSEAAHERAIKLATSYYLDPVSGLPTGGTSVHLRSPVPGRGLAYQIAKRLARPTESAGSHLRVLAQRLLHAVAVSSPSYDTSLPFHPDARLVGSSFPLSEEDEANAAVLMIANAILMRTGWAFDIEVASPAVQALASSSKAVQKDAHALLSAVVKGDVAAVIALGADRVSAVIPYQQSSSAYDAALGKARAIHLALLVPPSHFRTGAPVTRPLAEVEKALHVEDDSGVATVLSQADGHSCRVNCDRVAGVVSVLSATPPVVEDVHWTELYARLQSMRNSLRDYHREIADGTSERMKNL